MPTDTKAPARTFFSVSLEMVEPGEVLPCDVWLRRGEMTPVLYRAARLPFDRSIIERLRASGVETIQIAFDDAAEWADHVSEKLRRQLRDPRLPIEKRMELLLEASRSMMREVFDNPLGPGIRRKIEHLGDAVSKLMSEPGAFASAVQLMEHDYYTYTHSFHVSIFAVALARGAGREDESFLTSLGRGGLMHDVGKTLVPPEILNKPGRLNAEEFSVIRRHPDHGTLILGKLQWRDPVVRDVVLSHHERIDGSGYPRGLSGEAVSFAARVTALADAFDAMTTDRSYCAAKSPVEALRILRTSGAEGYDQQLFEIFVRMLLDPERCTRPAHAAS